VNATCSNSFIGNPRLASGGFYALALGRNHHIENFKIRSDVFFQPMFSSSNHVFKLQNSSFARIVHKDFKNLRSTSTGQSRISNETYMWHITNKLKFY
jgi:hypothetical protein